LRQSGCWAQYRYCKHNINTFNTIVLVDNLSLLRMCFYLTMNYCYLMSLNSAPEMMHFNSISSLIRGLNAVAINSQRKLQISRTAVPYKFPKHIFTHFEMDVVIFYNTSCTRSTTIKKQKLYKNNHTQNIHWKCST